MASDRCRSCSRCRELWYPQDLRRSSSDRDRAPAGDFHLRVSGNAAVIARVLDHGPYAVTASELDDGDSVSGLLFRMSSAVSGFFEARLPWNISRFTYSLLTARICRPLIVNISMPSLLSPMARSWLAPTPRVFWSNAWTPDQRGSPQLATHASYIPWER